MQDNNQKTNKDYIESVFQILSMMNLNKSQTTSECLCGKCPRQKSVQEISLPVQINKSNPQIQTQYQPQPQQQKSSPTKLEIMREMFDKAQNTQNTQNTDINSNRISKKSDLYPKLYIPPNSISNKRAASDNIFADIKVVSPPSGITLQTVRIGCPECESEYLINTNHNELNNNFLLKCSLCDLKFNLNGISLLNTSSLFFSFENEIFSKGYLLAKKGNALVDCIVAECKVCHIILEIEQNSSTSKILSSCFHCKSKKSFHIHNYSKINKKNANKQISSPWTELLVYHSECPMCKCIVEISNMYNSYLCPNQYCNHKVILEITKKTIHKITYVEPNNILTFIERNTKFDLNLNLVKNQPLAKNLAQEQTKNLAQEEAKNNFPKQNQCTRCKKYPCECSVPSVCRYCKSDVDKSRIRDPEDPNKVTILTLCTNTKCNREDTFVLI